ncbi:hypothetical protein EJB05_14982, partial [Eragrostis curvula]
MPSSGTGEEAEPRRAACKHFRPPCVPGCAFAPYFPPGDQRFAVVREAFGSEELARILLRKKPDERVEVVQSLYHEATRLLDRRLERRLAAREQQQPSAAAGGAVEFKKEEASKTTSSPETRKEADTRCAACRHYQRLCVPGCVFAPPGSRHERFAVVSEAWACVHPDALAEFLGGLDPKDCAEVAQYLVDEARRQRQQPTKVLASPETRREADADPRCDMCQFIGLPCGLKCSYSVCFPRGDFAAVEEVYGAKAVGNRLWSLPRQDLASLRNHAIDLVDGAKRELASRGVPWRRQCTACQRRRCKCRGDCIFAAHFPPDDDMRRFDAVLNIYGLCKFATLLRELPPERRSDAAASYVSEALRRSLDPDYFDVAGLANAVVAGASVTRLHRRGFSRNPPRYGPSIYRTPV